jgi:hypothetical protein
MQLKKAFFHHIIELMLNIDYIWCNDNIDNNNNKKKKKKKKKNVDIDINNNIEVMFQHCQLYYIHVYL